MPLRFSAILTAVFGLLLSLSAFASADFTSFVYLRSHCLQPKNGNPNRTLSSQVRELKHRVQSLTYGDSTSADEQWLIQILDDSESNPTCSSFERVKMANDFLDLWNERLANIQSDLPIFEKDQNSDSQLFLYRSHLPPIQSTAVRLMLADFMKCQYKSGTFSADQNCVNQMKAKYSQNTFDQAIKIIMNAHGYYRGIDGELISLCVQYLNNPLMYLTWQKWIHAAGLLVKAGQSTLDAINIHAGRMKILEMNYKSRVNHVWSQIQKLKCQDPALENLKRAQSSTVLIEKASESEFAPEASGSYLENQGLLTATHIWDANTKIFKARVAGMRVNLHRDNLQLLPQDSMLVPKTADEKPIQIPSRVSPILLKTDDNQPQPGQIFYASGFPRYSGGKMEFLRCEFEGLADTTTSGLILNGGNYFQLDCRGARGSIDGMSGGPVFDQQGRVWGTISAQDMAQNLVWVSPTKGLGH